MEETKYAEIGMVTDPESGEVTLYVRNEAWGPVVTGRNLNEAKELMKDAFGLAMIANSFCDNGNQKSNELKYVSELAKMNNTLQQSL